MKKISGIYCFRNIINGKRYIGSSLNCIQRKKEHLYKLKQNKTKNKKFQNSYNKHGIENFTFEILEVLDNYELVTILDREEYWIKYYDSIKNGYNVFLPSIFKTDDYILDKVRWTKDSLLRIGPFNLKCISKEEWILRRTEDPSFTVDDLKDSKSPTKVLYRIDEKTHKILETFSSITEGALKYNFVPEDFQSKVYKNKPGLHALHKIRGMVFIKEENYILPLTTLKPIKEKVKRSYKKDPKDIIPYENRAMNRVEVSITNGKETETFRSCTEAAQFLKISNSRMAELKKGYKNKGGGRISRVLNIKGWSICPILEVSV